MNNRKLGVCPICNVSCNTKKICDIEYCNNIEINQMPNNYTLYKCSKDHMIFSGFDYNTELNNRYYFEVANYSFKLKAVDVDSPEIQSEFGEIRDFISEFYNVNDNLLDIGTGNAAFLKYLYLKGYKHLAGIEPGVDCSDSVSEYNIKLFSNNIINDISDISEKYNFITMQHVLEHIYEIDKAFLNITKLLDEDGYLFIDVPDCNEYLNCYQVPYEFLLAEHVNHFSYKSLKLLLEKYGFIVLKALKHKRFNYPSIGVIATRNSNYLKLNSFKPRQLVDPIEDDTFESYIEKCNIEIPKLCSKYKSKKLIVWGAAGNLGLVLLGMGLNKLNIIKIVDENPKKIGKTLLDCVIEEPFVLKNSEYTDFPILIMSYIYKKEILSKINELGLKNECIAIY